MVNFVLRQGPYLVRRYFGNSHRPSVESRELNGKLAAPFVSMDDGPDITGLQAVLWQVLCQRHTVEFSDHRVRIRCDKARRKVPGFDQPGRPHTRCSCGGCFQRSFDQVHYTVGILNRMCHGIVERMLLNGLGQQLPLFARRKPKCTKKRALPPPMGWAGSRR